MLSRSIILSALLSAAFAQQTVPVPWAVSNINIGNIRHGTGGFWSLNILDTPTPEPQGFNTTCTYNNPTTYEFAIDGAPYKAPCSNPNVTFGLFPEGDRNFKLNITHIYGDCGKHGTPKACIDHGTWTFSWDDVRGQEDDVQNNFGQSGSFTESLINMYPTRAVPSLKCEFC